MMTIITLFLSLSLALAPTQVAATHKTASPSPKASAQTSMSPSASPDSSTSTSADAAQSKLDKQLKDFKAKVAKIKDRQKQQIVLKISDQIDVLNKNLTDHFSDVINKLQDLLIKISDYGDQLQQSGKDVTDLASAVQKAKDAIEAGQTSVDTQAKKTYIIELTTDKNLKQDVGKTRQAFHSDIVKTRDTVTAAKKATKTALQSLLQLTGDATGSTTPSTTASSSSEQN